MMSLSIVTVGVFAVCFTPQRFHRFDRSRLVRRLQAAPSRT